VDDKELASMDKKIADLQEKASAAKSKVKSMEASKSLRCGENSLVIDLTFGIAYVAHRLLLWAVAILYWTYKFVVLERSLFSAEA